jgi:hypothetical protein
VSEKKMLKKMSGLLRRVGEVVMKSLNLPNFTEVINRKGVIRTGSIQKKIGNTNLQRELGSGEK